MGVLAWHGATSAFLACRRHKFLLGGQFVAHPGEQAVTYSVRFHDNDPLVAGLGDVTLTSEQYYMLVDPAVKVLATTRVVGPGMDWVAGVEMPVAWTRRWGRGRVFYCSIGHTVDDLNHPSMITLLRRAAAWAANRVARGGD
jgi:type 1 glutamine amidotransferase